MTTSSAPDVLILHSGRVFTANRRKPWSEAVAVRGCRIASVGTVDELTSTFAGARMLDLGGRTALPGFIDAHNHLLATGESLGSIDVRYPKAGSISDVVTLLREASGNVPAGAWITASGLDDAKYERQITRWDLDAASAIHPIRVHHVSGHHVLVNSSALDTRGIDERTPDPQGGRLVKDASGRLTGWCLDAAMNLILPVVVDIGSHGPNFHTELSLEEAVDLTERAGKAYLEAGITTACDPQVTSRELTAYREAHRTGRLPVRTVCMPLSNQLEAFEAVGLAGPFGDDRLRIGGMKFYADGSLIGGTAAFEEPYGANGEFSGSMYWSAEELREMIGRAHRDGWQVGVHVQGDRAMTAVLDAIEAAAAAAPRDHRHRLEHAGYPTPELIGRIAGVGAHAIVQPSYLHDSGDEFLDRLGNRAHGLQPLRDLIAAGVPVVLSSDSDVCSYNPLDTIAAAMLRRTLNGAPIGPSQALTLEESLFAHTIAAAEALWMEDQIGSLEPGKRADLVVIDGDLGSVPTGEISELAIWLTMLDGDIAFAHEPTGPLSL